MGRGGPVKRQFFPSSGLQETDRILQMTLRRTQACQKQLEEGPLPLAPSTQAIVHPTDHRGRPAGTWRAYNLYMEISAGALSSGKTQRRMEKTSLALECVPGSGGWKFGKSPCGPACSWWLARQASAPHPTPDLGFPGPQVPQGLEGKAQS